MRKIGLILQVAFAYIGTIVGAGFASGQEILQFFTRYGGAAVFTIPLAFLLFIWMGVKLMLLAAETGARSYEDLNRVILGDKLGRAFSLFLLFVLLGTSTVMLAGAGSLFAEQLNLHYQTGIMITVFMGYLVVSKGIKGIIAVNSVVVPIMLVFTCLVVAVTVQLPTSGRWLTLPSDYGPVRTWTAPFLYAAFNLATAQAVLVPLGTAIRDRSVLIWGGTVGGAGIGLMLVAAHFALAAQMPGIGQFEIPMAQIVSGLGIAVQLLYLIVIFGEIFTTFVADLFGLCLQVEQRTGLSRTPVLLLLLLVCLFIAQIGFSSLLSVFYPLFGTVSLIWLAVMFRRRAAWRTDGPQN